MGTNNTVDGNTSKQVVMKPLSVSMPDVSFLPHNSCKASQINDAPCHLVTPCQTAHKASSDLATIKGLLSDPQREQLEAAIKTDRFTGDSGQILSIIFCDKPGSKLTLVGIGSSSSQLPSPDKDSNPENSADTNNNPQRLSQWWQKSGASIASQFRRKGDSSDNAAQNPKPALKTVLLLADPFPENEQAFLTGFFMRFDAQLTYKSTPAKLSWPENVTICSAHANWHAKNTTNKLYAVEACHFTRDLATEPGNILHPSSFVERILTLKEHGIDVTILDEEAMAKEGMRSLLSVSKGSRQPAYTAIMRWRGLPAKKENDVCLVGKGVTFDTGGVSLKPAAKMEDMKYDMCGAAVVCGEMLAIAKQKLVCNVTGIVGLVENMPDGNASRPGDVIEAASGKTIEIINTDAEGRLVLADLLWYAEKYVKPKAIINLATLTGAMVVSLGHHYAGMFTNNDHLADMLAIASKTSNEPLWRLPLDAAYDELIESTIADIKNTGGPAAGSITAAQFLQHFVTDTPWCHIDIAGVAWRGKEGGIYPSGATGYGVLLLNAYVSALAKTT